jgi:hypothetical protein
MQNGIKNGDQTQFTKNNQPSSEAKSEGWKRRRQRQQFLDTLLRYQDMTIKEFESLQKDFETNKDKYTIANLIAFKYASKLISSDKFLLDWIDRNTPEYDDKKEEEADDKKYEIEVIRVADRTVTREEWYEEHPELK